MNYVSFFTHEKHDFCLDKMKKIHKKDCFLRKSFAAFWNGIHGGIYRCVKRHSWVNAQSGMFIKIWKENMWLSHFMTEAYKICPAQHKT